MSNQTQPCADTLKVQLAELNNRGRQYAGQIWQVPFAYVGIVGVVLAQVADKSGQVIRVTSLCGALFGFFVLVHLSGMANGLERAQLHTRRLRAPWRPRSHRSLLLPRTLAR